MSRIYRRSEISPAAADCSPQERGRAESLRDHLFAMQGTAPSNQFLNEKDLQAEIPDSRIFRFKPFPSQSTGEVEIHNARQGGNCRRHFRYLQLLKSHVAVPLMRNVTEYFPVRRFFRGSGMTLNSRNPPVLNSFKVPAISSLESPP